MLLLISHFNYNRKLIPFLYQLSLIAADVLGRASTAEQDPLVLPWSTSKANKLYTSSVVDDCQTTVDASGSSFSQQKVRAPAAQLPPALTPQRGH